MNVVPYRSSRNSMGESRWHSTKTPSRRAPRRLSGGDAYFEPPHSRYYSTKTASRGEYGSTPPLASALDYGPAVPVTASRVPHCHKNQHVPETLPPMGGYSWRTSVPAYSRAPKTADSSTRAPKVTAPTSTTRAPRRHSMGTPPLAGRRAGARAPRGGQQPQSSRRPTRGTVERGPSEDGGRRRSTGQRGSIGRALPASREARRRSFTQHRPRQPPTPQVSRRPRLGQVPPVPKPTKLQKPSLWQEPGVPCFIFLAAESTIVSQLTLSSLDMDGPDEANLMMPSSVVTVLDQLEVDNHEDDDDDDDDSYSTLTDSADLDSHDSYHEWVPSDYSPVTVGDEDYF